VLSLHVSKMLALLSALLPAHFTALVNIAQAKKYYFPMCSGVHPAPNIVSAGPSASFRGDIDRATDNRLLAGLSV